MKLDKNGQISLIELYPILQKAGIDVLAIKYYTIELKEDKVVIQFYNADKRLIKPVSSS